MRVGLAVDHKVLARLLDRVQRQKAGAGIAQILQPVHPICHRQMGIAAPRPRGIVPAGPNPPPPRHQRGIAVQHRLVGLIGKGAQQAAFLGAGVRQHRQRLVGVGGQHHMVETPGLPAGRGDFHPAIKPPDAAHRIADGNAAGQPFRQRRDIAAAAALHCAPDRAVREFQQPVVFAKADEAGGGIASNLGHRR